MCQIFEMHNGHFAYVNDWCASLQAHLSHFNYSMKIIILNVNIYGLICLMILDDSTPPQF